MVVKWSQNDEKNVREIYLFLRFLMSGLVRHFQEELTQIPSWEFNKLQETSSNFMRFHDTWDLLICGCFLSHMHQKH